MWMFAGNSRDALQPRSRGKGPFESHPERRAADEGAQGALEQLALAAREHPRHRVPAGRPPAPAPVVHEARAGRRLRARVRGGAAGDHPLGAEALRAAARAGRHGRPPAPDHGADPRHADRQPRHELPREPRAARRRPGRPAGDASSSTSTGCSGSSGSTSRRRSSSRGKIYKRALEKFDVRLEDDQGFVQKGDTHFCFLVPERAFEDQEVLREAIRIGLVSKRLAACLLMVDPWNPVFSERRRALLQHVPDSARDREPAAAASRPSMARRDPRRRRARRRPARRRREFAERWEVGDRVQAPVQPDPRALLRRRRRDSSRTQAGFDAYFQLAEERRRRFKDVDADRAGVPAPAAAHEHHLARAQDAARTAPSGRAERCRSSPASARPRGCPTRTRTPGASACARLIAPYLDGSLPQFYDPTQKNTPAAATPSRWSRGSRSRRRCARSVPSQRRALEARRRRPRPPGRVLRVGGRRATPRARSRGSRSRPSCRSTSSTCSRPRRRTLLRLYRKLVDPRVELERPAQRDGSYKRENRWNNAAAGLAHLIQGANNLGAAIDLVARATVQRVDDDGEPVTNQQELVRCAGSASRCATATRRSPRRSTSPPREGAEITLADPPGLHLGRPLTAGMVTPDGADAARFWKIERGDAEHTLRARFEVPAQRGYVVGDIEIGGRADRVRRAGRRPRAGLGQGHRQAGQPQAGAEALRRALGEQAGAGERPRRGGTA